MIGLQITHAADGPIATVNGKAISKKVFEQYLQARNNKKTNYPSNPDRIALINELVQRELLFQEAIEKKMHKDSDIAFQLEQQRVNTLINALVQKVVLSNPITESDMKAEYDQIVNKATVEYKARHILVDSELEAKSIITELDKGADFASLAKEKSTGPSGKQGGDLGWFIGSAMVAPFAQAITKMKKGTYSKTPVKTKFGYHVIKFEDTRPVNPPKFEDVKEQVRSALQNKLLKDYIDTLRSKAKIKIN